MTNEEFDAAYHAFCRRRPFQPFPIEFTSGHQATVVHPETVRYSPPFYVLRRPDGGYVLFVAESVSRLLDPPMPAP